MRNLFYLLCLPFTKRFWIEKLENFFVWGLTKLNIERLKKLTIDDKRIVIGISKFIPDDGEWHNVASTVSAWIKISKKRKFRTSWDDVAVFIDGKKKSRKLYKIKGRVSKKEWKETTDKVNKIYGEIKKFLVK